MADEVVFDMVPITGSSQIAAVGYNKNTQQLKVEFIYNGSQYLYFDIPEEIFTGLINAPSVGSYFNAAVKHGGFRYQKVA